jgi:hypothetical protein
MPLSHDNTWSINHRSPNCVLSQIVHFIFLTTTSIPGHFVSSNYSLSPYLKLREHFILMQNKAQNLQPMKWVILSMRKIYLCSTFNMNVVFPRYWNAGKLQNDSSQKGILQNCRELIRSCLYLHLINSAINVLNTVGGESLWAGFIEITI